MPTTSASSVEPPRCVLAITTSFGGATCRREVDLETLSLGPVRSTGRSRGRGGGAAAACCCEVTMIAPAGSASVGTPAGRMTLSSIAYPRCRRALSGGAQHDE
eukprot:scaffold100863_cov57-Phaeocystis_antarctica.AAC.1